MKHLFNIVWQLGLVLALSPFLAASIITGFVYWDLYWVEESTTILEKIWNK